MTGRSSNSGIETDPRWRRLQGRKWECAPCGKAHTGIFDIAYDKPAGWADSTSRISNADLAPGVTHFLADDYCVMEDEDYFVRCVLELPIVGTEDRLGLGVWSTLLKKNFILYLQSFRDPNQGRLGPWFGWFSNRLSGYPDTLNLKCQVRPRDDRQRPTIEIEASDHPLSADQRNGISIDRLIELYAAHGHDLRAALSD